MFLRATIRKKDGKLHRYFSVRAPAAFASAARAPATMGRMLTLQLWRELELDEFWGQRLGAESQRDTLG